MLGNRMFIDPLTRNPAILDALPRDQNNDRPGPLGILGCRRHLNVDIGSRHRKELYRKRTTKSSRGILNWHLLTLPEVLISSQATSANAELQNLCSNARKNG